MVTLTGRIIIEGGTRQAWRAVVVTVTDMNDAPSLAGFGLVLSVQQDALAVPVAALALIETSPIQLAGEAFLRARIENTDGWNAFKNLLLDSAFWQPAMGTKFLLANFVDVRWDLAAQSAGFDIVIAGAKRGLQEPGGGGDLVCGSSKATSGTGSTPPRSRPARATTACCSPMSAPARWTTRCWPTTQRRPTARCGTQATTAATPPLMCRAAPATT